MTTPITPFYQSETPPPPCPLLTIETDLTYVTAPVPTVTTSEEVTAARRSVILELPLPRPNAAAHRSMILELPRPRPHAIPGRSGSLGPNPVETSRRSRSSSPYVVKKVQFREPDEVGTSEESESDDQSSSDGSEASDTLIPKPQGQAGRPNRGGYNLEAALGWPAPAYAKLQVCRFRFQFHVRLQN